MKSLPVCLSILTLAVASTAQTGPGWSRMPSPSWMIVNSFNSVPGNDLRQVFHVKLANNGTGRWTTALTVGGLPFFFGGDDSSVGVAIGEFDPYAGTFLIGVEASPLNSSNDDQHLTLSPDGLWAIFERRAAGGGAYQGVFLAGRAQVGQPFGAPVAVTGFGGLVDVYPNLGPVDGAMKVFYSDGTDIVMQDIDLQNATLTGSPVVVHRPVQAGATAISPTPVLGADGDVEALWTADLVRPRPSGDSDPVWANDLDPSTPGVVQIQRSDYQCCGGLAGGFVYFSHDISPRWHLMHGEGAWLVGDDEQIGGFADVRTAGVHFSAPNALISTLFLSTGEGPKIGLPGIGGALALDASLIVQIATFSTTSADGVAEVSFPIPNNAFFRGKKLALQAVVSDLQQGTHTLTNTAWLHFR